MCASLFELSHNAIISYIQLEKRRQKVGCEHYVGKIGMYSFFSGELSINLQV
jgi:hypothetical protein